MHTPTGSRWMANNNITRCHRRLGSVSQFQFQLELESVGDKKPEWDPATDRGLWALSDPRLSSPAKMRMKCCYGREKNFGSICSSLSPSLTHLSLTRNINPFENKVWEVYSYKEVCSFVHWSRHYVWLCSRVCWLWVYKHTPSANVNLYWKFIYHKKI